MLNSTVGRPQGRGKIERFFQTLNECVLIDLPGFSIKGKPATKPSISLVQLEGAIVNFILEKYHKEKTFIYRHSSYKYVVGMISSAPSGISGNP